MSDGGRQGGALYAESHDAEPRRQGYAEGRTWLVLAFALLVMGAELLGGQLTNSLALQADGWHMATHAGAFALSAVAYWYARRGIGRGHFVFGAGKVYALAGFANAVVLALVAVWMIVESIARLAHPEAVRFAEALPIAIVGLIVNVVSVKMLEDRDDAHRHDHNLRAVYLHVLADLVTSVLAVVALVLGRVAGVRFADPLIGALGSLLILKWGVGLARDSARELLDIHGAAFAEAIRTRLERDPDLKVGEIKVWSIGAGRQAATVSLRSGSDAETAQLRSAILEVVALGHLTVEVHRSNPRAPGDQARVAAGGLRR